MNIAQTIAPARHRLVQEALAGVDFDLASPADAEELAYLFEKFFAEADYKSRGIVYSHERAKTWLERVITSGSCPHIVARSGSLIIGVTSYSLDGSFCEKPVAVLGTLYVVPEHRRSAVGRILVAVATEAAIGDGACAFHAPIASGMVEMKTLKNLFTRAGFVEIGTILGRGL